MLTKKEISQGSLCAIGIIGKAFGIKGELTYNSFLRTSSDYINGSKYVVGPLETDTQIFTIEKVSKKLKGFLLKFEEVNSRSEAEKLINNFIFVPFNERKKLSKSECYIDDVIGSIVFDQHSKTLGVVKDILNLPAHQSYIVETNSGKEVLVPIVKEIVKKVEVGNKKIIISPPEGMFNGEAS
ncbi:MAG: ribosome maturation factor RimM [Bacteroidetes bacterium]|nr:ribosome maturation factor RimM [Bacteroidota bacterium]